MRNIASGSRSVSRVAVTPLGAALLGCAAAWALSGCVKAQTDGGPFGTGGSGAGGGGHPGTGGATGQGGASGTGGATGVGGATGTGGATTGTGGKVGTGGATGSGGSTGAGGNGTMGTGGTSASGGSTGAAGGGATTFFTDDFESDTTGQQPAGFDNLINYNYKATQPGDGSGTALVDGTHVHGGSKAVHFAAKGGSIMALLERPLPTGTNHLYVRVYVYLANSIGDEPGSSNDNHESMIGLTADPTNANTQVRFGQIKGAIGTNESVSDNIAPIQADWNMGAVISGGAWHCVEVEFDGTAAYNSLYAYSDGALVHSITSASDWAHAPGQPATWMSGRFVDVFFGWQSFSSTANDVWMDDLAMSSTGRIGCN